MKTINGRKFAKNDKEFIGTLFNKEGGTAVGFYKELKGRIMFYDMQNKLFACLVHNKNNEKFFVSASIQNGKPYYMFGLSSLGEKTLGFDTLSYTEQNTIAQNLI